VGHAKKKARKNKEAKKKAREKANKERRPKAAATLKARSVLKDAFL